MKVLVIGDAHSIKSRIIEILKEVEGVEFVYESVVDTDGYGGINPTYMVIDELSEYTEQHHKIMVERVEKKKANKPYYRKNERW